MLSRAGLRIGAVPVITVLVLASVPTRARGQATAPAIGTRVLVRPGAVLKVGDRVVDTGGAHHLYTVERAKDNWFWLNSGASSGWARAADLIPFDRALGFYNDAIQADPNAAWAYYNRGVIWYDRKEWDRAIADDSQALRLHPGYVAALINRGNAWAAKGDSERAIADYSEAVRLEPTAALAYLNRAIAWQAREDLDHAIADYDEAIRLGLKSAAAYNNRGHAWEMKGDYDRAIADYSEALRITPGYRLSWLNRANAWKAKGESARAHADYERAKSLDPSTPAHGGGTVAQTSRRNFPRETKPNARTSSGPSGVPPAGTSRGTPSGANLGGNLVLNPGGVPRPAVGQPRSFYGANYALPSTGGSAAVLPQGGGTNIGYRSSAPTYYTGNLPASVANSPVRPVNPSYYGANYSGKSLVTPGAISGTNPSRPTGTSFYGANYSGTVIFRPGPTSGAFPNNPTGTSFYGADYSGTSAFIPGSGGLSPNSP